MFPFSPSMLPVVLGLLAAATWGAADFAGGLATRRAAPSRVVLIAHGISFVLLGLASLTMPASLPAWGTASALLSGIAGGAALMLFYEALSIGAMGLSAAVAGLLTAVLPVIIATRTQGPPQPMQIAGFAVAGAAIILIAYAPPAPGASTGRRALLFAIVSGCGFGLQLVLLHMAVALGAAGRPQPDTAGFAPVLRALLLSRFGGVVVAAVSQLLTRARHRDRLMPAPEPALRSQAVSPSLPKIALVSLPVLAALAGLLDTAGNGLYMVSSLSGRLDVAAVLSSLYPGGTIVLAAIFLRERATRLQTAGMALALVAVGLIAA